MQKAWYPAEIRARDIAWLREVRSPNCKGRGDSGRGTAGFVFGRRSSILAHACIHVAQHTLERLLDAKPTARMPVRVDMERLLSLYSVIDTFHVDSLLLSLIGFCIQEPLRSPYIIVPV